MQNTPLVSIGIPNFNYGHFVIQTLNSVAGQDYENIEVIIIDDFSTDNSIQVIEDWITNYSGNFKILFLKNTANSGLTKICNQLLKSASGKYIQFLDADDWILPGKISMQVALLEAANATALIYSDVKIINEKGEITGESYLSRIGYEKSKMPYGNIHQQLFDFNFIPLPSVLIVRRLIDEAGGFDELLGVQDYYMWLKLTEKYNVIYMHQSTAVYRVHSGSMSNSIFTNPRSVNSVLAIKYNYYKNSSKIIRNKILTTIHYSSVYLYKTKYPTAGKWLKIDCVLKPGVKNIIYLIASGMGIGYSFFEKLKSAFGNKKIPDAN